MSETENSNGGAPPRTDDDHQDATREEVRRVIQEVKKSVAGAAREVGISYPTFAAWLNGTYQGNNDRVEDAAAVWLDARKVKGALGATMPVAPGFIDTAGSVAVISVLEHAQHAPDFVVITGASGLGKTMTCEAYQKRAPSVWIVTCQPCISTPRAILQRIMDEFCGSDRVAGYRVAGAIVKRMQGTGGLLIVDEAQHLSSAALDQLRTIYDLAGIGIALVGNPTIYSRLEGDGRRAQFAQLYSRVGMRLDRQRDRECRAEARASDCPQARGAAQHEQSSARRLQAVDFERTRNAAGQ
jgi:DNA transposition AAA+ family ATPase